MTVMALNRCCSKWRITQQERVMEIRDSGVKRVLRLRDGDSERGSVMQGGTRARLGGTQVKREIEHKALLPQVQALYTRATDYLVSNYKTISHQA